MVVSQTGIAGSTKVGDHCQIGGQVGIAGHLTIGDRVRIAAQSGIGSNLADDGTRCRASPAFAKGLYDRSYVVFRNLPALQAAHRCAGKGAGRAAQGAEARLAGQRT